MCDDLVFRIEPIRHLVDCDQRFDKVRGEEFTEAGERFEQLISLGQ